MTAPTEAEVRAWLEGYVGAYAIALPHSTACATAALAMLDEARKDMERLDSRRITLHTIDEFGEPTRIEYRDVDLRAAIDQARGA